MINAWVFWALFCGPCAKHEDLSYVEKDRPTSELGDITEVGLEELESD